MSTGMPELGSKISLISKADIRYEGRLFTVDPQECTIALANVRSFGTEDRETQFPVAPQSQVYDYILFRGTDIKDIRVLNNQPSLPNDPAIMQMSVPPTLGGGGAPPGQFGGQFSHPVVGQNQYPQYHPMAGFPGSVHNQLSKTSELSPQTSVELGLQQPSAGPIGSAVGHHINQVKDQGSMLDLIGGGSQQNSSRSGTPGLGHRKSPTADQGTQAGPVVGAARESRRGSQPQAPKPHPPHPQHPQHPQHQPQQQRNRTNSRNRQRYPSGGSGQGQMGNQQMQNQHHQNQNQHHQNQHHQNQHHQNQHHQNQHHQGQNLHHQNQNQHHQNQHHQNQNQHHQGQNQHPLMHNQHQGEFMSGGYNTRGGGGWRGRGRGGRGRGGFAPRTNNKLKFDKDYDFEQANTEFEELRTQLAKAKIGDGEVKPEDAASPLVAAPGGGGGGEADKKDDSGNETGAGEPEPDDETPSYDKSKSFFDNISCEAVERSKGRSQRTDWRTERKLNSETFGVASARRGAWRGRGGWRQYHHQPWRPMRGGGGGGPRGRGQAAGALAAPAPAPLPQAAESK